MEVDVAVLDDVRDAWRSGNRSDVRALSIGSLSLGACVEAACWAATADTAATQLIGGWGTQLPTLAKALVALTTADPIARPPDHGAPSSELTRCPSRTQLVDANVGVEWAYFLDRFRRSLHARLNVTKSKAWALSAALHEMVDNVVEHAGLGEQPRGVVAYEVSADHFGFAVADLGRGALASLRDNPTHDGIRTDAEALRSAIIDGASRRAGPPGKGFADLLRSLADLEGSLSFRTGSARLLLDGRGSGPRRVLQRNSPNLKGFQLEVRAQPLKSVW